MRQKFLSIAVALVTFGVVTGGIVGVGLMTAEPVLASATVIASR